MSGKRILIVEDEATMVLDLQIRLRKAGYIVAGAAYSGEQALDMVRETYPDLVLMDINLGEGMSGIETARKILEKFKLPVVYTTAYTDIHTVQSALKTNPYGYITKPIRESELLITLQMAFRKNESDIKLNEANQKLLKEIEERKKIEQQLNQTLKTTRTILEEIPIGIAVISRYKIIKSINRTALDMLGMESPEKVIGKECRVFNCPKDNDECPVIDLGMKKNQCETSLLAKGGKSIATFKTVIPITLDNEDVLLEAFSDITEIKETEKALKISEQNFREANAMKDKLFSIIAHDLRNAFTIVLTGSYLLAEQIDHFEKAKVVKYAKNMHESAEKIDKLLENLLTWSRLQMNAIKMNPARLDIAEVVRQNINLFCEYARQKKITLKQSIPDGIFAYADQDMVNTVLRNLINNALKFSHAGGKVHVFTANEAGDFIEIAVSDNGVGIEAEYCEQVFMIDSKFKEKGTAGETGNGLGLPLCKEFIEKNGGEIRVESEVGKGSTFLFSLPKWRAPAGGQTFKKV